MYLEVVPRNTDSFALALAFKGGPLYETDSERGLSHMLEHVLVDAEAAKALRAQGVSLNAETSRHVFHIYATGPKSAFNETLQAIFQMVTKPNWNAFEIEKSRVRMESKLSDNTPFEEAALRCVFGDTALANPIIGDLSLHILSNTQAMYTKLIRDTNASLFVVGPEHHTFASVLGDLPRLPKGAAPKPIKPKLAKHPMLLTGKSEGDTASVFVFEFSGTRLPPVPSSDVGSKFVDEVGGMAYVVYADESEYGNLSIRTLGLEVDVKDAGKALKLLTQLQNEDGQSFAQQAQPRSDLEIMDACINRHFSQERIVDSHLSTTLAVLSVKNPEKLMKALIQND